MNRFNSATTICVRVSLATTAQFLCYVFVAMMCCLSIRCRH